jgi:hypothetical protein
MALGKAQPLTDMSTRDLPGGKGRPERKADNLTILCQPNVKENMVVSTSHNPAALHSLLQEYALLLCM